MSTFLMIGGLLLGLVGLVVPAILGAALIISGAVLFASAFVVMAIEAMHTTLSTGQTKYTMHARTQRQCPACREIIRIDALRCKYCTTSVEPQAPPPVRELFDRPEVIPAPRQVKPDGPSA